jgi:hypothetical protein
VVDIRPHVMLSAFSIGSPMHSNASAPQSITQNTRIHEKCSVSDIRSEMKNWSFHIEFFHAFISVTVVNPHPINYIFMTSHKSSQHIRHFWWTNLRYLKNLKPSKITLRLLKYIHFDDSN